MQNFEVTLPYCWWEGSDKFWSQFYHPHNIFNFPIKFGNKRSGSLGN